MCKYWKLDSNFGLPSFIGLYIIWFLASHSMLYLKSRGSGEGFLFRAKWSQNFITLSSQKLRVSGRILKSRTRIIFFSMFVILGMSARLAMRPRATRSTSSTFMAMWSAVMPMSLKLVS